MIFLGEMVTYGMCIFIRNKMFDAQLYEEDFLPDTATTQEYSFKDKDSGKNSDKPPKIEFEQVEEVQIDDEESKRDA